jgi:serine/threonine protein kinase
MLGRVPQARLFRFGPFELDSRAGELRKHGIRIKVREQPVRILLMLVEHPGEVVLRDEIRLKLWPNNTIVEFDHGINAAIQKLRDALGESAGKPRYVETVARRGYRFLGEVERIGGPAPEPPLEPPPESEPPPVPRGSAVSHYRLLDKLGEGGMGVVYRAEDLKLGRHVAVKFLPLVEDDLPDSVLRRFEREARAASALNHPNICTIHGLEDFDGRPAIVMELVEGETLAARLARGPLPVEESVRIAVEIADALAEAHRHGVVHRDLKPANIMLTGPVSRPGVKVLDFGLAKMERPVTSSPDAESISERGVIVGSLHYMSPEQVEGKDADARSDIFSFGLVLYEMAIGRRAFEAESRAGLIAAILEKEPPPFEPEWLNRVVRACIAKDPNERFQTARDVRRALEWSGSAAGGASPSGRSSRKWLITLAAVFFAALAATGWMSLRPSSAARLSLTIVPPAGQDLFGSRGNPEISPDGSSVLYGANGQLWMRRLDALEAKSLGPLTNDPILWSPDSRVAAFRQGPGIVEFRLPDGPPQLIAKFDQPTRGGSWGDNGTILLSSNKLYEVPASGGEVKPLDARAPKQGVLRWPQFLPGGDDFLFLLVPSDGSGAEVYLATLRDGQVINPVMLMKNDTAAAYTPVGGGCMLFVRNDNLYAQQLDRRERRLVGQAKLVQKGVASVPRLNQSRACFSVSRTGVIAWRAGRAALNQLTILDRRGKQVGTAGPPGSFHSIALSPDETRLLAISPESWLFEPGQPGRISLGTGSVWALWSPDGARLFGEHALRQLTERAVNGGEVRDIRALPDGLTSLQDISPDGKEVLAMIGPKGLVSAPVDQADQSANPKATLIVKDGYPNGGFSPDGRWIVYGIGGDDPGVYVQPFPEPGLRTQIDAYGYPVWRKDGKEILIAGHGGLWSVTVQKAGSGLHFGAPEKLFSGLRSANGLNGSSKPLAVSRDGSRIYFVQAVEQPANSNLINILSGWWHN